MQERRNCIANALELRLSCANASILRWMVIALGWMVVTVTTYEGYAVYNQQQEFSSFFRLATKQTSQLPIMFPL